MIKNYYAIKKGLICPAVVTTWKECEDAVRGFPGAKFKKFSSEKEAWDWINEKSVEVAVSPEKTFETISVYSDGACSGNPGPGGWGAIVKYSGQTIELSGYSPDTTNNCMELTGFMEAVKFALQNYGKGKKIIAYLDSQYVLNGASSWMLSWAQNGWKRPKGEKIVNVEMWKELYKLLQGINIEYKWIKGHNGHPENERCDQLAVNAYKCYDDEKEQPAEELSVFTNFDLFRVMDKETLVKLLYSNKFSSILFTETPIRMLEIMDKPAIDWGVDTVSKILKSPKSAKNDNFSLKNV